MDITEMIALTEIRELERGMRARRQRHELAESRRARSGSHGLRERLELLTGTALSRPAVNSDGGAACATC